MKYLFVFILFFPFIILQSSEDHNEIDADSTAIIMEKMIRAVGRVDFVEKIATYGMNWQPIEEGALSFAIFVEVEFPDKLHLNFQGMDLIVEGDRGWRKYYEGYYENLNENMIRVLQGNLKRNVIFICKYPASFRPVYQKKEIIQDKDCYILFLDDGQMSFQLAIDCVSHLPWCLRYHEIVQDREHEISRYFLEYTTFSGITYPTHIEVFDQNKNKISAIRINQVIFNDLEAEN
ncbi:MAG: hypothetical protein JXB60_08345 [Candidatus Cloacimonetes bacterium]|nr:hypothetical protein [Candidatus Cloacimonadota bacterium]